MNKLQIKLLKCQIQYNIKLEHLTDINKDIVYRKKTTHHELIDYIQSNPELIQPLKSYAVAIIYSLLIEKYFNISFYDSINNDMLLFNNDKFFTPYYKNKKLYKKTIDYLGKKSILSLQSNTVKSISEYFFKEFNSFLK